MKYTQILLVLSVKHHILGLEVEEKLFLHLVGASASVVLNNCASVRGLSVSTAQRWDDWATYCPAAFRPLKRAKVASTTSCKVTLNVFCTSSKH